MFKVTWRDKCWSMWLQLRPKLAWTNFKSMLRTSWHCTFSGISNKKPIMLLIDHCGFANLYQQGQAVTSLNWSICSISHSCWLQWICSLLSAAIWQTTCTEYIHYKIEVDGASGSKNWFEVQSINLCPSVWFSCILTTLLSITLGRFVVNNQRKWGVEFGAIWTPDNILVFIQYSYILNKQQKTLRATAAGGFGSSASWLCRMMLGSLIIILTWSCGEADVNQMKISIVQQLALLIRCKKKVQLV